MNYKLIVGIMAMAVVLSGCTKKMAMQKQMEKSQNQAFGGKPTKCTYYMGDNTVTAYMKDGKVRSDMGDYQNINDGEFVYMWNESTKTGSKMTAITGYVDPESETGEVRAPTKEDLQDVQEMVKQMQEEFNAECKQENISDSMFVPPADVTFTDMTEQMQRMQEMRDSYGQPGAEEMSTEEVKKLMEESSQMMKDLQMAQ